MNYLLISCSQWFTIIKTVFFLVFQIFITSETHSVRVTLNEDLPKFALGPEFISPVQNQTAAIGREVTFSCSVRNIGKFKVGWLRASDKMIISLHTKTVIQNERISVKYEPIFGLKSQGTLNDQLQSNHTVSGVWRLIIRQLKETDRGCYMCQINTSPMISQLGCLDILVSPDILNNETSTDISVKEGENATLLCKATGRPMPNITWRREDGSPIKIRKAPLYNNNFNEVPVFNESVLHFYRVDRQQMGTYLCIASNEVHPAVSKRVTLAVNFLPNVQTLNQLLGAPLGTDVILECRVEAHPNAVNYWYRNTNNMLLNGPKYSIIEVREGYKIVMRLTIKQFHESDVGSYSCVSSNSLGTVEGISRLYRIDGRGVVHESQHISILAGVAEAARGFGIKCDATSNILLLFIIIISFITNLS